MADEKDMQILKQVPIVIKVNSKDAKLCSSSCRYAPRNIHDRDRCRFFDIRLTRSTVPSSSPSWTLCFRCDKCLETFGKTP